MPESEYILSHRLHDVPDHRPGRDAVSEHLDRIGAHATVVDDSHAEGEPRVRRSIRMIGDEALFLEHQRSLHEHVILERRVMYRPHQQLCQIAGGRHLPPTAPVPPREKKIQVRVFGGGQPLAGAEVSLKYLDGKGDAAMLPQVRTDANGGCELHFGRDCKPLAVGVYPACGYWSAFVTDPGDAVELHCEPLEAGGPLGWWHRVMGVHAYRESAGAGIRVGLIGTGVSLHPNLAHIVRVDGQDDLSAHGTHVCGIVTARPGKPGDFAGFAPAASVFTRRVFQFDKDGQISLPDQRDLAAAIEDFSGLGSDSGSQMDLINLSLGGAHSDQTHDAVKVARQNGTLCVCSAGNSSGGVEFPAAYPEAAAVTALGKKDWGPRNSITALMTPDSEKQPDRFAHDGLFLALFSCFGASVNCTAPGAGIISTVPPSSDHPAPYAVMDGTSLSCPAVVGVLADVLSRSPAYMSRARDAGRSDAAVALLRAYCESIGLDSQYAGAGMPDCTSGSGNPIRDSIASNRESSRK